VTKVILGHEVAQVQASDGRTWGGNHPGRVFDVADDVARDVVAVGGAYASLSGTTRQRIGYRCPACGFGSFTRTCGRCGQECHRE
jgi:hypothetical protein